MPRLPKVLSFLTLLFAFPAALFNFSRTPPFPSFFGEFSSLCGFGIGALFLIVLIPEKNRLPKGMILSAFSLLIIISLQWFLGLYDFVWMPFAAIFFIFIFVFFFSLGQISSTESELRRHLVISLCSGSILFAFLNAILQSLQWIGFDTAPDSQTFLSLIGSQCRPTGNIFQANHANTFAIMGVSSLLYLWQGIKTLSTKYALPLLLIFLWSSGLSASRMGWLQMISFSLFFLFFSKSIFQISLKRAVVYVSIGLSFFFVLSQAPSLLKGAADCLSAAERFSDGFVSASGGQGNWYRMALYRQAILVWESAPWLGVGIGNFLGQVYFLETHLDQVQAFDFYTHNLPFQILSEIGIVGFLLFLIAFLFLLKKIWCNIRSHRFPQENFPMLAWVLVIGIHAMLEQPLHYLYFFIPFSLALGILYDPVHSKVTGFSLFVSKRLFAYLFAILLAVSIFILSDYLRARQTIHLIQKAVNEAAGSQAELRAREHLNEVLVFHPYLLLMMIPMEQNPDNDVILRNLPHPPAILWQAVLEMQRGDEKAAEITLLKLQVFHSTKAKDFLKFLVALGPKEGKAYEKLAQIAQYRLDHPPSQR